MEVRSTQFETIDTETIGIDGSLGLKSKCGLGGGFFSVVIEGRKWSFVGARVVFASVTRKFTSCESPNSFFGLLFGISFERLILQRLERNDQSKITEDELQESSSNGHYMDNIWFAYSTHPRLMAWCFKPRIDDLLTCHKMGHAQNGNQSVIDRVLRSFVCWPFDGNDRALGMLRAEFADGPDKNPVRYAWQDQATKCFKETCVATWFTQTDRDVTKREEMWQLVRDLSTQPASQ